MIANPIFDKIGAFLDLLLEAVGRDPKTRALFVVPYRPNQTYQKRLEGNHRCKLVAHYAVGANVFSSASKENPLSERREAVNGANEQIQIWEISALAKNYATCDIKDYVSLGNNLIPQFANPKSVSRKGPKPRLDALKKAKDLERRKNQPNEQDATCAYCKKHLTSKRIGKHSKRNCPRIACQYCNALKSSSKLPRHERGCLEGPNRKCRTCQHSFHSKARLRDHRQKQQH